jgi:hypothetical protein
MLACDPGNGENPGATTGIPWNEPGDTHRISLRRMGERPNNTGPEMGMVSYQILL